MPKLATKLKPTAEAAATAAEAGFRYAEFWLNSDLLGNHEQVIRIAETSGLTCALHFPNRGELSDRKLTNAVDLYRQLGWGAMVIHEPMLSRYGEQIRARDPAIRLGVENHRLRPSEFLQWASRHDWLTLDVEHLWKYTLQDAPLPVLIESVNDFLRQFGDKLVHVHLPGYTPGGAEHRPMYCSRDMVLAVLSALNNIDFDGMVVSEVNAAFQNEPELKMDVLLHRLWLAQRHEEDAGLRRADSQVA